MILLKTVGFGSPFVPQFEKIPQAAELVYQTSLLFPLITLDTGHWNIGEKTYRIQLTRSSIYIQLNHEWVKMGLFLTVTVHFIHLHQV